MRDGSVTRLFATFRDDYAGNADDPAGVSGSAAGKSGVSGEWRVVTVAGVGLIGGSFALALRQAGFAGKIIGVSSPATVQAALQRGAIDEALPLAEAAAQSDVIYLAQPISRILETLNVIDGAVRPGTLITDAGSTKRAIVERAQRTIKRGRFVGGHPMAGKEARGVEAADANLFRTRPYVLTAGDAELERWIEKIGARLVKLDAAETPAGGAGFTFTAVAFDGAGVADCG